jgi:Tol biopolymer transport system component
VISADGGTPRMLLVGEFDTVSPTWMPDGNSIVFNDTASGRIGAIKVVDTTTLKVTVIPDSKNLFATVTSPDGRYIAGPSIDSQKLLLYDFGSRTWSELLKMNVGSTNWSKDSKYIYFDTGLSENPAFYRVRVADRKLERLTDLKGFRRMVFGWLPWSGIAPDGSPLLLRDISSQEVYALDFETP